MTCIFAHTCVKFELFNQKGLVYVITVSINFAWLWLWDGIWVAFVNETPCLSTRPYSYQVWPGDDLAPGSFARLEMLLPTLVWSNEYIISLSLFLLVWVSFLFICGR